MIVIADTTPLNYLVLIGQANLLPRLYVRYQRIEVGCLLDAMEFVKHRLGT